MEGESLSKKRIANKLSRTLDQEIRSDQLCQHVTGKTELATRVENYVINEFRKDTNWIWIGC